MQTWSIDMLVDSNGVSTIESSPPPPLAHLFLSWRSLSDPAAIVSLSLSASLALPLKKWLLWKCVLYNRVRDRSSRGSSYNELSEPSPFLPFWYITVSFAFSWKKMNVGAFKAELHAGLRLASADVSLCPLNPPHLHNRTSHTQTHTPPSVAQIDSLFFSIILFLF